MGVEIDLLRNYPVSKRNLTDRLIEKSEEVVKTAREFGAEFFDGDRKFGYGGFQYDPRFWFPVIPSFNDHWNFHNVSSLLDVGCAKGFMLNDIKHFYPHIRVAGVDISEYAIRNARAPVKSRLVNADAKNLPFPDDSFDIVVAINTIHNLEEAQCRQALREIQRVARKFSFVTVDAYKSQEEKRRMMAWNLTAKTIHSTARWREIFAEEGYTGDYFWFTP